MSNVLFKMLTTNYSFRNHVYLIYVYKEDLVLNNQQGLIYHKIHLNNYLTMCKQMISGRFENKVIYKLLAKKLHIYITNTQHTNIWFGIT